MSAEPLTGPQMGPPARSSYLPEKFLQESALTKLRTAFVRHHYVALPGLFAAPSTFAILKSEIKRLEQFAKSRNFVMPGYNTPRVMATLGGPTIRQRSPLLTEMYDLNEFTSLVSQIVGHQVYPSYDDNEWSAINWLSGEGETHGWHLDDAPYSLVIFIEAPSNNHGGALEFITDWQMLCATPRTDVEAEVSYCRQLGLVQAKTHVAGDAYLLRGDSCLHRVAPITNPTARRVILLFSFEATPNTFRRSETAARLYES